MIALDVLSFVSLEREQRRQNVPVVGIDIFFTICGKMGTKVSYKYSGASDFDTEPPFTHKHRPLPASARFSGGSGHFLLLSHFEAFSQEHFLLQRVPT